MLYLRMGLQKDAALALENNPLQIDFFHTRGLAVEGGSVAENLVAPLFLRIHKLASNRAEAQIERTQLRAIKLKNLYKMKKNT